MASPQVENGYTKIANELYDAIIRWKFSSYEYRVLIFIIRKTYGWEKKSDWISLSQFVEATKIQRTHICRTINSLIKQNIITKGGNRTNPMYGINKDYELWKPLPKGDRSHHPLKTSVKGGNKVVSKGAHTKDNIQKKEILEATKVARPTNPTFLETKELITYFLERFERANGHKQLLVNWGKYIKLATPWVKLLGLAKMKSIVDAYLMCEDKILAEGDWPLGTMLSDYYINKLK